MFSIPFTVERSEQIQKPVADVFAVVSDFNTWKTWSPWICQEPGCPVDVTGTPGAEGHHQQWDGERIGSGEMTLKKIVRDSGLFYDLFFLKPWKSHSKVEFKFEPVDGGTRVTWGMQGTLPVFLFFLKKMMSAWVGEDYKRGLSMLKDYVEEGDVHSRTDINGEQDRKGFYYIGRTDTCDLKDMGTAMEKDYKALEGLLESGAVPKADFCLSLYHKFDIVGQSCSYTACLGYHQSPEFSNDAGFQSGQIADHKALHVTHTGPYRHLGNAWATAMGYQRFVKKKAAKDIPMYEVYTNMPGEVADQELQTEIFLPSR